MQPPVRSKRCHRLDLRTREVRGIVFREHMRIIDRERCAGGISNVDLHGLHTILFVVCVCNHSFGDGNKFGSNRREHLGDSEQRLVCHQCVVEFVVAWRYEEYHAARRRVQQVCEWMRSGLVPFR
jgi:hypothetical protein